MSEFIPERKPKNYFTVKQWAEQFQKFPINLKRGKLCFLSDKSGRPIRDKTGEIVKHMFYGPDDVRTLTKEDEKYLLEKFKSYKPIFTVNLDFSLDKNLGKPIRKKIEIKPEKKDEYDKKVYDALKNTPFKKIDTGTLVAYDTETTGVSKGKDEILQITILKENGETLLSTYIKPYKNKTWPKAEEVNHISPSMVSNAPYPHEIAPMIRDIFLSADEILGYNVQFDNGFVTKCLGIDLSGKTLVDPFLAFKGVKTPSQHNKLGDAVLYYCPEKQKEYEAGAHDAATDIKATLEVYKAQQNKLEEILNDTLKIFKEELIKCETIDEVKKIIFEFKEQGKESLKNPVINEAFKKTYNEAKEILMNKSKENDTKENDIIER